MSGARQARVLTGMEEVGDWRPLLRLLIVIGVIAFGALALTYLGLAAALFQTDRSHISSLIVGIFLLTTAHCLVQTAIVSRELKATRQIAATIERDGGFRVLSGQVVSLDGRPLPRSVLARHIANLSAKSRAQGGGKLDQVLLLRSLADQLRRPEKLGWFVAESLLRLALLGTAVGFIFMLIPIAGLKSFDVETLRSALSGMSGGMAVALNVTVTGIGCALLLKLEYYILDSSISELFQAITEVTEVHIVSALERPGMDEFGLSSAGSDDGTFVPFTDILFNALLGLAVMVFMAFALINPEAKTGTIDVKAEFIVTVQWPDDNPDDVDTYLEDPIGNVVWYHSREAGFLVLDRDDRGNYRDTITVDGKVIQNPLNQESVTVRKIIPGEYVVNISLYLAQDADPLPVRVKVEKVNPKLQVVYYGTLTMDHKGQEVTAVRFTVASDGSVGDVNTRPKSLIQAVRSAGGGKAR